MPTQRKSKYDEDLRFLPATEEDSDEELMRRADRLMRSVVSGGAQRREAEQKDQ